MQQSTEQQDSQVAAQPVAAPAPAVPVQFAMLNQFATDLKSAAVNFLIKEGVKHGTEEVTLDNLQTVVNAIDAAKETHPNANRLDALKYIIAAANHVLTLRDRLIADSQNKQLKTEIQLFLAGTLSCLDTLANHSRKSEKVTINGATFEVKGLRGLTHYIGMTGSDLAVCINRFHKDWHSEAKNTALIVIEINPAKLIHDEKMEGEVVVVRHAILDNTISHPAPGVIFSDLDADSQLNLLTTQGNVLANLNSYQQRFKAQSLATDAAIQAKKDAEAKAKEEAAAAAKAAEAKAKEEAAKAPVTPVVVPPVDAAPVAPVVTAQEDVLPPAVDVETPAAVAVAPVDAAPVAPVVTAQEDVLPSAVDVETPAPVAVAPVDAAPVAPTSTAPASTLFQPAPAVEQPVVAQEQVAEVEAEAEQSENEENNDDKTCVIC